MDQTSRLSGQFALYDPFQDYEDVSFRHHGGGWQTVQEPMHPASQRLGGDPRGSWEQTLDKTFGTLSVGDQSIPVMGYSTTGGSSGNNTRAPMWNVSTHASAPLTFDFNPLVEFDEEQANRDEAPHMNMRMTRHLDDARPPVSSVLLEGKWLDEVPANYRQSPGAPGSWRRGRTIQTEEALKHTREWVERSAGGADLGLSDPASNFEAVGWGETGSSRVFPWGASQTIGAGTAGLLSTSSGQMGRTWPVGSHSYRTEKTLPMAITEYYDMFKDDTDAYLEELRYLGNPLDLG